MEQFKTLADLREYIKKFEKCYARPIVQGEHPTLYLNPNSTNKEVINGIQRDDYIFSMCGKWVLEKADLPSGLKFIVDPRDKKKHHYLLCAVERMRVEQLRLKLQWVADRMSVIRGAQVAL